MRYFFSKKQKIRDLGAVWVPLLFFLYISLGICLFRYFSNSMAQKSNIVDATGRKSYPLATFSRKNG